MAKILGFFAVRSGNVRTAPHEINGIMLLVGVRGFEPPTPCSRSRCATRLRYTPFFETLALCPRKGLPSTPKKAMGPLCGRIAAQQASQYMVPPANPAERLAALRRTPLRSF